jgi:hypothetical protein
MGVRDLCADFRHLPQGHRFVAFILQKSGGPPLRVVPDYTFENDDGAVLPALQFSHQRLRINDRSRKGKQIALAADLCEKIAFLS